MKLTMDDIKQLIVIAAISAVGVIAAIDQNWQLVSTIITGGFALLHFSKPDASPNVTNNPAA